MSKKEPEEIHSPFEDRFFAIVEQSPFSIQIISPEGLTTRVNKAWEELWGATLDQIKDYNILKDEQLVKNGVMPYLKRALEGEQVEVPPVMYDPDETLPELTSHPQPKRWTKAVIYPIKDALGKVQEVILMHQDITAQVIAEEKIKAGESRYSGLLENANDVIYSHDLQGNYLSINKAGEMITGYTREEVLSGMRISQIVVPEHLERAQRMTMQKIENPSPTVYEIDIFAKDGRRLTLEVSTRISFQDDRPVAVEGVARDVTERKRTEKEKALLAEQIANQKKHLQAMVSSVPGIVWEAWGEPDAASQRIDFVSDYVETMLGYSVEEWVSTPNFWATIVHPDDLEAAKQIAADNYADGKGKGVNEFRWIAKDGRTVWVESQSVTIRDKAGNPLGMRGVTMDITERKQKEAIEKFLAETSFALASSLNYETTLSTVTNLAVPIFADWCSVDIANEDGALDRLAVAHVDPEKVAWAHQIYQLYPPSQTDSQGLYHVFRTGQSEFYPEFPDDWIIRIARDEKHLELMRQIGFRSIIFVPLKIREKILGVLTFVKTESDRRYTPEDLALAEDLANRAALAVENAQLYRAEQKIRQAAERTSNLLKRLQAVSISLSQALTPPQVTVAVIEQAVKSLNAYAGAVVTLNAARTELELIGAVNFPPEILDKWQHFSVDQRIPMADAIREKTPVIVESIESWGERYPSLGPLASVTGSRALVAYPLIVEGQVIGALGLSFTTPQKFSEDDRTFMLALAHQCAQALERTRLYEMEQNLRAQAEAANKMKDEFLATVSHELRTPLNAIVGWSSMLVANKFDEDVTARAIQTIERNAKAQAQIIEDLLDVSRIVTGNLNLNLRPARLDSIIKISLESLQPLAETKNIRLKPVLRAPDSKVLGDPDRLQQVMWNLLSNAIKFTPEGGEVEIKLETDGSQAEITVKDNGQGINAEFLPFVFERFRQADAAMTRKYGGLGLGLAIVRHLVEMHQGTVEVESAGLNQGTTFTVKIPLLTEDKSLSQKSAAIENEKSGSLLFTDLKGLRILVVDDEEDARILLKTLLESCQATIAEAASAAEAFERLESFRPQIMISDIGMPDEDGYSLIRRIRQLESKEFTQIPAIALTAYAREEDQAQALAAGYQKYLAKPLKPEDLLTEVKALAGI